MSDRRGFFRWLAFGSLAGVAGLFAARGQLRAGGDCRERCQGCASWGDCGLPRAKKRRELLTENTRHGR